MIETIRVDEMRPSDGPAVLAIYAAGIATGIATFETAVPDWETWTAGHRPDCRFVARDEDGTVLGWTAVSQVSGRCVYEGVVEESVYVAAEARGRGVGRALLARVVEACEAAGIWTIQAGVIAENEASLRLHEGAGFRLVGVRERIGRDAAGAWRNVVLLERRSDLVGTEPARGPTG
jgi:phosphinothricin acetyltransferase